MAVFSNNFPAYTNLKINQMTKCKLLSHQKVIIRRAEIDTNKIANGKNKIILHFQALMLKKLVKAQFIEMSNLFTINTFAHFETRHVFH